MSERRPFREVKLQWLRLLSCDANINDNAKCVALYIVTAHVNGHTEKAWPSYKTIAEATGKSVKSIQRAIRDLEIGGWLNVQRGNGVGHNTEYRPTDASILKASELREKTDKSVPLAASEGGQICPERRSDVSGKGGQICPPNLEKEKNLNLTRVRCAPRPSLAVPFPSSSFQRLRPDRSMNGTPGWPKRPCPTWQGSISQPASTAHPGTSFQGAGLRKVVRTKSRIVCRIF